MKFLKIQNFIIVFFIAIIYISIASGSETDDTSTEKPVMRGKLFCVQPAETFCLKVVDYPRDKIDKLIKSAKYGDIENFFDTNTYITDTKSTDKL